MAVSGTPSHNTRKGILGPFRSLCPHSFLFPTAPCCTEKIAPTEDSEAFSLGKAPQAVQSHPVSSPSKPKAATIDDAEYGKYWRTSATPGGNGGGGGAGLSEHQPTYRHQWFQTAEKVGTWCVFLKAACPLWELHDSRAGLKGYFAMATS